MIKEKKAPQELSEELVRYISGSKNEPEWMLKLRLDSLALYEKAPMPKWGPDLSALDLKNIIYYSDSEEDEKKAWEDVPAEISETFEKLGIPKAEREYLGGLGAQYDSNMVYHRIKESLEKQGVIFENMDTALQKYHEMVREYFMIKCVKPDDHKFAMLHGALWSGGTFIYVPKGVRVSMPLQAFFWMNKKASAQMEHTLIIADENSYVEYIEGCSAPQYNESSLHVGCVEVFIKKGAEVKYISIENWSKNTYNLNTKRALVEENGKMNWIGGNMGAGITMLYPSSVLIGEGAKSEYMGLALASGGQVQDTGAKAIHLAQNTSSIIHSRSISKGGGISNFRGLVKVSPKAKGTISSMVCDSLVLDEKSASNSYPSIENKQNNVQISHEAKIGKIGELEIFYLQSRGLSEHDAVRLIVGGFAGPVIKALPFEYAVELNKLLDLEI